MADDRKRDDDYKIDIPNDAFNRAPSPLMRAQPPRHTISENAMFAILSYCGSSILMTVTNKYVLSGRDFNLNFFLLCVQVGRFNSSERGISDTASLSYASLRSRLAKAWG